MQVWKFIAASCLLATAAGGCARPQSISHRQAEGIQRGDSFALLTPAKSGTVGAVRDGAVVNALTNHIGAPSETKAARWQVEYSFSARPADIAMTTNGNGVAQPRNLATPGHLFDCKRTSYRMAIRIVDATNGTLAYQASAEEHGCANSTAEQEAVFGRFVPNLVTGIKVQ